MMETYDQVSVEHAPELRYEMGFTSYPVTSSEGLGSGLAFNEYEWTHAAQEAAHSGRPAIYPIQDGMAQQYGSFIGYSNLPHDELGVVPPPTYIPAGEMSFATPLNHLPYTGHENYYGSSFNTISPTSTGSGHSDTSDGKPSHKPKRKRVQTQPQRKAANVRERRRMFHLNEAFDELRKRLPAFNYEKRLSRIETLRLAMTYIAFMKNVSDGKDPKEVQLLQTTKGDDIYNDSNDSD